MGAPFLTSRRVVAAVFVVLCWRQPALARDETPVETVTTAPVLVTTEGKKPRWDSVEALAKAAESGQDAQAAFEYARLLEAGDLVDRDEAQALTWYRRAAEAGHPDALFRLGKIHHDGLLGQPVDYTAAVRHYRQAAARGIPEAMFNLGAMHVSARGVKRDYVEGLAWLIVSSQHGAPAEAGIQQVRQRLSRRPEWIAAAEQRAVALAQELKGGPPEDPANGSAPAAPAPPPGAPVQIEPPARPALSRPKVELEKPTLAVPEPSAPAN